MAILIHTGVAMCTRHLGHDRCHGQESRRAFVHRDYPCGAAVHPAWPGCILPYMYDYCVNEENKGQNE